MDTPLNLLKHAYAIAASSYDPSTQNGALLFAADETLIFAAANLFPGKTLATDTRLQDRNSKYGFVQHAERRVISYAARYGKATLGGTLVCPWMACDQCAGGIVDAGITRVIGHKQAIDRVHENWRDSIDRGRIILAENDVIVELYDGKVGGAEVRFNYEIWYP